MPHLPAPRPLSGLRPAGECVRMVRQLEEETGESVRYIVLPTFGYEHKVGAGGGGPGAG